MSDNRDKMSSRLQNGHFTWKSEKEMSEENVKWKSETNMLVGDARWTEWWIDRRIGIRGVVVNFDLGERFPRPRFQQRGELAHGV